MSRFFPIAKSTPVQPTEPQLLACLPKGIVRQQFRLKARLWQVPEDRCSSDSEPEADIRRHRLLSQVDPKLPYVPAIPT